MHRSLLAITLVSLCLVATANEVLPAALAPAEESAALASAATMGMTIYRHDQAAAVATDAILSIQNDERVRGWVTEQQGKQIIVTFINDTPAALYRVPVTGGKAGPVVALEAPAALSAYELGAASARSAVLAAKYVPCSPRYNVVILPGATPAADWIAYLIPGTTKNDVVPIGGTYRFVVKDTKVISQRGFTHTCIALKTDPKAVALMITHLLDSVPTEAHVFWSMWAKKPLFVATAPGGTIWSVEGDRIKLIERKAAGN
jgi:hypothetical protein